MVYKQSLFEGKWPTLDRSLWIMATTSMSVCFSIGMFVMATTGIGALAKENKEVIGEHGKLIVSNEKGIVKLTNNYDHLTKEVAEIKEATKRIPMIEAKVDVLLKNNMQ